VSPPNRYISSPHPDKINRWVIEGPPVITGFVNLSKRINNSYIRNQIIKLEYGPYPSTTGGFKIYGVGKFQ